MRQLAHPRTLHGLVAAVEQQSRVWLPLQMATGGSMLFSVLVGAAMAGLGLWLLHVASAENDGSLLLQGICLIGCGVFVATRNVQRTWPPNRHRGWEVNFEQRTLTPVWLSGYSTISLGPDFSLGCYLGSDVDQQPAWLLELRHVRRGPVATLMMVPVGGRGVGDARMMDRCVDRLAERLGIRRSGSLLGPTKTRQTS
jgi:hypothetical protein